MKKKITNLKLGDKVKAGKYGEGEIVEISENPNEQNPSKIYSVQFHNGDVRHFRAEELK